MLRTSSTHLGRSLLILLIVGLVLLLAPNTAYAAKTIDRPSGRRRRRDYTAGEQ